MRRMFVLLALVIGVLLVQAGPASAGTINFNAEVKNKQPLPKPRCPDGAYLCGEAKIAGFGTGEWRWYLHSFEPLPQPAPSPSPPPSDTCGDYTATATFTLQDESTLFADEVGEACSPGNAFSSYPRWSFGQPTEADGTWVVTGGTGQFSGMTGDGTDTLKVNGADVRGTYTGTLQN